MQTTPNRKIVGTREGAEYFGVTQETLRKWIKSGTIKGYRVGTRIKIDLHESERMILAHRIGGDA